MNLSYVTNNVSTSILPSNEPIDLSCHRHDHATDNVLMNPDNLQSLTHPVSDQYLQLQDRTVAIASRSNDFIRYTPRVGSSIVNDFDTESEATTKTHNKSRIVRPRQSRLFFCNKCNKSICFSSYRRYMRFHSGNRPYACSVYNKTFVERYNFKQHERIHRGEQPYSCKFCSRKFNHQDNLKSHEKIIHDSEIYGDNGMVHAINTSKKKSYVCSICSRGYSYKKSLIRHYKSKHVDTSEGFLESGKSESTSSPCHLNNPNVLLLSHKNQAHFPLNTTSKKSTATNPSTSSDLNVLPLDQPPASLIKTRRRTT